MRSRAGLAIVLFASFGAHLGIGCGGEQTNSKKSSAGGSGAAGGTGGTSGVQGGSPETGGDQSRGGSAGLGGVSPTGGQPQGGAGGQPEGGSDSGGEAPTGGVAGRGGSSGRAGAGGDGGSPAGAGGRGGSGGSSGAGAAGRGGSGGSAGKAGSGGGSGVEYRACEMATAINRIRVQRLDRDNGTCTVVTLEERAAPCNPLNLASGSWCIPSATLADLAACTGSGGATVAATAARGTFSVTTGAMPSVTADVELDFPAGNGRPATTVNVDVAACAADCAQADCRP